VYYATIVLKEYYQEYGFSLDLNIMSILAAVICYFLAHIVRAVRLVGLTEDPAVSLGEMMSTQLISNSVNLVLPFRLGEAYRVVAFKSIFGSSYRSFIYLLVERIFDFATILLLFYIACLLGEKSHPILIYIHYFAFAFAVFVSFLIFALEEMLSVIHRFLLSRYTSKLGLRFTEITSNLLSAISDIKDILSKRLMTFLSFTVIIWTLEITVFSMFLWVLDGDLIALLFLASLVFLSSLMPSGPIGYGGAQLAFYITGTFWGMGELVVYSIFYNLFIFLPGVLVGGAFFLMNLKKQSWSQDEQ